MFRYCPGLELQVEQERVGLLLCVEQRRPARVRRQPVRSLLQLGRNAREGAREPGGRAQGALHQAGLEKTRIFLKKDPAQRIFLGFFCPEERVFMFFFNFKNTFRCIQTLNYNHFY